MRPIGRLNVDIPFRSFPLVLFYDCEVARYPAVGSPSLPPPSFRYMHTLNVETVIDP